MCCISNINPFISFVSAHLISEKKLLVSEIVFTFNKICESSTANGDKCFFSNNRSVAAVSCFLRLNLLLD